MKHPSPVAAASDALLFYDLVLICARVAKSISRECKRNGDKSEQRVEGMATKWQSTKINGFHHFRQWNKMVTISSSN